MCLNMLGYLFSYADISYILDNLPLMCWAIYCNMLSYPPECVDLHQYDESWPVLPGSSTVSKFSPGKRFTKW